MAQPISLRAFRSLLEEKGIRPSKALGQNFLFDPNLAKAIVEQARIEPRDSVLEIGVGCGYLTAAIAQRARRILAVEKDLRLLEIAKKVLSPFSQIEFWPGSFLEEGTGKIPALLAEKIRHGPPWIMVSNLPYSVAAPILVELAFFLPPISRMVVTVQKEVAERAGASSGGKERGALGVLLQLYYRVKLVRTVPSEVFWPRPRVQSAVLSLERNERSLAPEIEEKYRGLVDKLFQSRRKQLQKTLREALGEAILPRLASLGIDPQDRPENLEIEQILGLFSPPGEPPGRSS